MCACVLMCLCTCVIWLQRCTLGPLACLFFLARHLRLRPTTVPITVYTHTHTRTPRQIIKSKHMQNHWSSEKHRGGRRDRETERETEDKENIRKTKGGRASYPRLSLSLTPSILSFAFNSVTSLFIVGEDGGRGDSLLRSLWQSVSHLFIF